MERTILKNFLQWLLEESKYHGIETDGLVYFEDWEDENADDPYAPLLIDDIYKVINEYENYFK